jgi:bacterioferritin-associated ferredoxin
MQDRDRPLSFGVDWTSADAQQIAEICRAAHMHEEQMICYCRQVQAREVAAAIVLGHRTPESLAVATGIRTGCGVLCITSVLRLLKAADVEVKKAPGWQWYGAYVTIWDLPQAVRDKYSEYFLNEDYQDALRLYPSEDSTHGK